MTHRPQQDGASIVVECDFDEPPEKVWRALTTPELVAAWLSPSDINPKVGTRFTVQDGTAEPVACEVLAAEPPRSIRYSWRTGNMDSVVSFELAETADGGTHLRLVHSDFVEASSVGTTAAPSVLPLPAFAPARARRVPRPASRVAAARRNPQAMRLAA